MQAIDGARHVIELNEYLLTSPEVLGALRDAAARGVAVYVIIDGHPYDDAAAPRIATTALAGSGVLVREAPRRFEGAYAFDHAKYLVVDPGSARERAILGSQNATTAAFGNDQAEDAIETSSPSIVTALAAIFRADWRGVPVGPGPRAVLVVSPGSQPAIASLLSTPGPSPSPQKSSATLLCSLAPSNVTAPRHVSSSRVPSARRPHGERPRSRLPASKCARSRIPTSTPSSS